MTTRFMTTQLRPALVGFLALTALTGIVYPLAMTGLAKALFPRQAGGSLVWKGGAIVGSALIGQDITDPSRFWGRPSATLNAEGKPQPCNAMASGGSNLGPSNPDLAQAVKVRIATLKAADPEALGPVPIDLVTTSASGLDPHISPAAALFQVPRVARRCGLDEARVIELVTQNTESPQLGFLGEPRVNVLKLNLALAQLR